MERSLFLRLVFGPKGTVLDPSLDLGLGLGWALAVRNAFPSSALRLARS